MKSVRRNVKVTLVLCADLELSDERTEVLKNDHQLAYEGLLDHFNDLGELQDLNECLTAIGVEIKDAE